MKLENLKVSTGLSRSAKSITTKGMQMVMTMATRRKNNFRNFLQRRSPAVRRPAGVVAALWLFLFIILILLPSFLSVPIKSRESGGIVLDSKEYDKELLCLKNALWHETRSEPEEGIRAVMSVIYNRKNHKNYPNTFCKVILQDKQFSAFNSDKSLATKPLKPIRELDKEAYRKVSSVAQEAVQGVFKPVLDEDVLHYAHTKVKNKWTRRFERVKVIHQHVFYKEI